PDIGVGQPGYNVCGVGLEVIRVPDEVDHFLLTLSPTFFLGQRGTYALLGSGDSRLSSRLRRVVLTVTDEKSGSGSLRATRIFGALGDRLRSALAASIWMSISILACLSDSSWRSPFVELLIGSASSASKEG